MKEQLEEIISQLALLRFEMALIVGALVLLTVSLFTKKNLVHRIGFGAVLLIALLLNQDFTETQLVLTKVLSFGPLETYVKLLLVTFSVWIIFYSNAKNHSPEFYFLILSLIIGAVFMTSANHLLVVYIAIELTSFSSYIITNFNFKKRSFEAGIKYLLFGGVSSAIMLYGISIIYGVGGSLHLSELFLNSNEIFLAIGLLAFLGGLFFKISVFPFHIWTPGAYEEAPTDAVAVFSVVPKVAGLVLLHRVLLTVDLTVIYWMRPLLVVAGIATIVVGTLGALRQENIKRLMAYGAIAHSGLMLATLLINGEVGYTAFVWYVFVYAIMNLALFYVVSVCETSGIERVSDFAGLGKEQSYFGALMLMIMVSLIGLPPTAGFTAKFYLFAAMWSEYEMFSDPFMLTYLIVGILSVAISLVYYLKIPFHTFIKNAETPLELNLDVFQKVMATILVTLLLWFFLRPEILNNIVLKFEDVHW